MVEIFFLCKNVLLHFSKGYVCAFNLVKFQKNRPSIHWDRAFESWASDFLIFLFFEIEVNLCKVLLQKPLNYTVQKIWMLAKNQVSTFYRPQTSKFFYQNAYSMSLICLEQKKKNRQNDTPDPKLPYLRILALHKKILSTIF